MATPSNIILQPSGLILENYNTRDITILSNNSMAVGIVRQVYDDSGIFSVGDVVIYNKENSKIFKNNSATFQFINEQDVYFGEQVAEPEP